MYITNLINLTDPSYCLIMCLLLMDTIIQNLAVSFSEIISTNPIAIYVIAIAGIAMVFFVLRSDGGKPKPKPKKAISTQALKERGPQTA